MTRVTLAALALAVSSASLAGCMHHGIPRDRSVETTIAAAPARTTGRPLKVVTFNVQRQPGDVIARALRSDRELRDADIIIMAEVHRRDPAPGEDPCSAACVVAHELGFHARYAPGHVQDDGTDGVAVISRMPILAAEVIELPHFDVHWNDGRRIAMAVTVELDRAPITVYAVHLENRITVAERRTQMMPVLEHAKRQTTPVIIAGDFNTSPFTWITHAVPVPITTQDDPLEALVRAHGFDTPVVDSGATSRYLGMKLDAIYTRGFDVGRFATSNASEISDHIALWANVRVRDRIAL